MEGIGEKFRQARRARNLSLEEAARMTKIRPTKLAEIEAEDFSHFPSLAYAKGFLLIYGKFLNVDVTPYLDAFESSETITVDGYSYLQDNPALTPPRRSQPIRKAQGNKASLLPLVIGIVVLVAGFTLLKVILDIKRLPSAQRDAQALAAAPTATPVPAPSGISNGIVAPKALPLDQTAPSPTSPVAVAMAPTPIPMDSGASAPQTALAPATVATTPEAEPEVRRAEPVHAEDLAKAQATLTATTPSPFSNRFDIRPLRKTYLRVTVDSGAGESIERWINVSEAPLQFSGKRIAVKVLDPDAVEIRKNGKIVTGGDADVRLE